MRKILIIGSSFSIKETFSKKFINDKVNFCNFRACWENRNLDFYDVIVLSGYHHIILQKSFNEFNEYINHYLKFVSYLQSKTESLYFISTYIPKKLSFSRLVFFYRFTLERLFNKKKITIIYFKKILDSKNRNNLIIKMLKIIGMKFTKQIEIIKFTDNFYLKSLPNPNFYFLKIRRPIIIERILRLLDID